MRAAAGRSASQFRKLARRLLIGPELHRRRRCCVIARRDSEPPPARRAGAAAFFRAHGRYMSVNTFPKRDKVRLGRRDAGILANGRRAFVAGASHKVLRVTLLVLAR